MIPGKTIISEEVFAQLVKMAITKVAHAELAENEGSSFMSLAKRMTEKVFSAIAIKKSDAEVDENGTVTKGHASFVIKVDVEYGSAIPDVLEDLRQAVVKEVVFMTDYQVDYVDVIVSKLLEKKEEAVPEAVEEKSE